MKVDLQYYSRLANTYASVKKVHLCNWGKPEQAQCFGYFKYSPFGDSLNPPKFSAICGPYLKQREDD